MEKTWMPTAAGILSIVAGAFGFLSALTVGLIASVFLAAANYTGPGEQFIASAVVWAVFLPIMILSVVAIIGGVYALKRRLWALAMAGAICALLTVWGWVLGVAALIFVILSKHEFDRQSVIPLS